MMLSPVIESDVATVASALAPLGAVLSGRRIFVTGCTGFFGCWLLRTLLALRQSGGVKTDLVALTRDPDRFLYAHPDLVRADGLLFLQGDVRTFDFSSLRSSDFIIHGATSSSLDVQRSNPDDLLSVIVDGTRHVLAAARACGAQRLLYVSSGAVYGTQPPSLSHLPEAYEGEPATVYGKGKKLAEQLCLEAGGNLACVIARPFAFVGPHLPLDAHFAIGNFIRDSLSERPIVITGDGRPYRSYLYAADLALWLWTLLLRGRAGLAYNVGSPEAISISELATLVSHLSGGKSEVIIQGASDPAVPPPRYVPDVRLAEATLGLRVTCPLSEAIRRTLAFAGATV